MKIRDFILSLVSWFILLVTVSCSDELGGERAPISSESNLHVLVPTVLSSRGIRTDDAAGLPTYNATVDECQINDLTLYAFPVPTGNGNDGKLLVETLPAPLATMMVEPNVANYQLNIEPGTYHIYVVANMNKVLSGQPKPIQTEDDLKKIVLGYGVGAEPGMPVSTNIPMIYEPEKDAAGNLAVTEIKAAGDKYTEVAANLKFTCVKVKLNLIFDPNDPEVKTNFGGKPFSINNILAKKLSPFTYLYWGGKFETPTWEDNAYNKTYKEGIPSTPYEASSRAAVYYTDWTDNRSLPATNNKDDIKGTGTAKENPVNPAGKWLFQQTYYLPERYISSESDRSYLTINGNVGGSVDNNYRINLGHKKDETSTVPVFPRGTFYEITGAIKTLGNMELNCKVSVKDWKMVPISADFNHTTLWVSKTEASVTSTTNDIILYNSNAIVEFGCDNTIFVNGKNEPIIIQNKRGKDANGNDSIEFRVNPDIPISSYPELKRSGTAKFWLKANNLKKYIDVKYDVKPYLDVTPKEFVIYYEAGKPTNTKVVTWDTNLGGIKLEETKLTKGKSTIEMNLNSSDAATGTFTVTATTDPETTTIHEFTVKSKDGTKSQTVRVKVSPPIGDYRIYFRAINDRSKYNGGNSSDNFKGILTEGGTNNWSDGWNENANDTSDPITNNHRIYVYTQIGETEDAVTGKGWLFTDGPMTDNRNGWPGEEMVADMTNTGWYYKDFAQNAQSVLNTNSSEGKRTIKPGETLIMFSNNTFQGQGYSLHRCPHHLEPGIPLFDYEDREGWIVYDPTSDPIWRVHDDMPEIENIEFKVYTQFELFGWYKVYGIASGENQFTIWDTKAKKSWKCEKVGKDWYKTTIKLKAVKGEHEKNILLKKEDNDKSPTITLFDGNSYEKYGDTGYYQGDKWHQGKPNGVTE